MKSSPPAPSSPAIVSRSGRPAAISVPNASTSKASVSGHDSASDFIIAALFAWLKSDHMAAGPVRRTVTPEPGQPGEAVLQPARGLDHLRRLPAREPGDDRGAAVARDGDAFRGAEHAAHGPVAAKHVLHRRALRSRGRRRRRSAGHDDRQRVRSLSREVRLDRAASGPRLRAWSLPTGPRERLVRERRKRPEAEHDDPPDMTTSRRWSAAHAPRRPRGWTVEWSVMPATVRSGPVAASGIRPIF